MSEYVAEVGNECDNPGGLSTAPDPICVDFSESFVRLMMFLIVSF